jgi:hypothetical protein
MSRAIASARQRRAGVTPTEAPPVVSQKTPEQNGLTLQQVISLVDTRLTKLEKYMNDAKDTEKNVHFSQDPSAEEGVVDISTILEDFNNRFVMLAEEISTLKDSLLKLQSYTMDVNKMLLEERNSLSYTETERDNSTFLLSSGTELKDTSESV